MTGGPFDRGDKTALVVVDMLNPYDHQDADVLADNVRSVVEPIARLVDRAQEADIAIVYVNDNYGDWNSSVEELTELALQGRHPELVRPVLPPSGAYFVIKPRHTIFYQTPLDYLLEREQVGRIVLTGQVTEQCILYSALDGYVRHLQVAVPSDAVAHIHRNLADAALEMMERNMRVDLTRAHDIELEGRG